MRTALAAAFATAAVALTAASGCANYTTHVEADDAALGRIVVYRNGIAYYERTAEVIDGRLTMTVPHDKVDDFLKSLTVADALTGKPLPVSFQTTGATRSNEVDMIVQAPDGGRRQVVLTYITESPAWKPSYRVVVDDNEVRLQGWAVVDNTSGESWDNVKVGVGSSSALSFRYDLRTVRNVFRQTLSTQERFAVAPPTGGSTHGGKKDDGQVLAAFDGAGIPAGTANGMNSYEFDDDAVDGDLMSLDVAMTPPRVVESTSGSTRTKARQNNDRKLRDAANKRKAAIAKARQEAEAQKQKELMTKQQVATLARQIAVSRGKVVIEGYAKAGESQPDLVANDRANWLRNELIREGVAPARLQVDARGFVNGNSAGVKLVQHADPAADPTQVSDGAPVGESHFESDRPVTVAQGTSAMIAILDDDAKGDIVYVYDAESERGNKRFAFKSIRFKNPTEYTLETGPMTVYGDGRFIGEGLAEPIPPRATALVPFALDRQVIVEKDAKSGDRIARLTSLQRGVLRSEVKHTRTTTLKITSMLHKPTHVFVRHTVRKGWDLADNAHLFEHLGEQHVFRVEVPAGESKTLEIVESTPLVKAIDVRSPQGMDLVRVYLESDDPDGRFAKPLKALLALHTEMADVRQHILTTRERMTEFRSRMSEIQLQIESMAGLKGGRTLMKHLQTKLKDMSDRVQKATISVVDLQEKLMLSRIRFQDGVSELSLEQRVSEATTKQ